MAGRMLAIGDVHGCYRALVALLRMLELTSLENGSFAATHRKLMGFHLYSMAGYASTLFRMGASG